MLGKDYLLKRNQYKNFQDVINAYRGTSSRIRGQKNQYNNFFRLQDVINAYRGTSTEIVILDDEYPMFTES